MIPEIAVAADFYIHFEKCKITVGYLVLSNESLKTIDGDGSLTSCTRNSQSVHCEFDFQGQGKGTHSSADYKVRIETPPLLIFTDENMSDYYVIDQVQHAATLITRVMEPKAAGAKVCQGMYMTESEFQNMNKSKQK
jgi:hypothetical protein